MKSKSAAFFLFITLFLLLMSIAYSQYYQDYTDESISDSYYVGDEVRIPDWYDVSDEELQFCQSYAGTATTDDYYGTFETAGIAAQPVSKLTLTAQGEYTTEYDKRLYEFGWYVHPAEEDETYAVVLVDIEGNTEELTIGSATALDGDAGYETLESEVEFLSLQIVIVHETGEKEVVLQVPIVEKIIY